MKSSGPAFERCRRQVEGMKAIGRALGSGLELDDLLPRLVQETGRILEAERSTLYLADLDREELWSKVLEGWPRTIRLPFGQGLAGWVAAHRQTLRVDDAYRDDRFDPSTDHESGYRTRGVLAAPVLGTDGTLRAVLQVLNGRAPFREGDEALLEAIAGQIGVLLDASELYRRVLDRSRELSRAHRELRLLFEVEKILGDGEPSRTMLDRLIRTAVEGLAVRAGVVWSAEEDGLRVAAASSPSLRRLRHPGPAEAAFRDRTTFIGRPEKAVRRLGQQVQSQLLVPIQDDEGRLRGVLELVDPLESLPFDDRDLSTLSTVAARIGRALSVEAERERRIREERWAAAGQALTAVVHDLRNPLTLIQGVATQLEDSTLPQHAASDRLRRQVDRIDEMCRELLSFVRGEPDLRLRPVELVEFRDEVDAAVREVFSNTQVRVEVEGTLRGQARLDRTRLRRLFENLARNSRDVLGRSGRFRIRFDGDEGGWRAEVEDDGPGIPEAIRHRLFEAFVTLGKPGGTGLGLALARQVAEAHGGSLRCLFDGAGPSRGARFRLELPRLPQGSRVDGP